MEIDQVFQETKPEIPESRKKKTIYFFFVIFYQIFRDNKPHVNHTPGKSLITQAPG